MAITKTPKDLANARRYRDAAKIVVWLNDQGAGEPELLQYIVDDCGVKDLTFAKTLYDQALAPMLNRRSLKDKDIQQLGGVNVMRHKVGLPDVVETPAVVATPTDITAQLGALNDEHFFTTMGGKAVIGSYDRDRDGQIPFVRSSEVKQRYANQRVVTVDLLGKQHDESLFESWLKWTGRTDYDRVVFAPPPEDTKIGGNDFNLWENFAVEPVAMTPITPAEALAFRRGDYVPGRCYRMLHHLRHVIANGDPLYYDAWLNWVARMIQRPGEVAGSAHVWVSEEGTGKNLAVEYICRLFHKSMIFTGASDLIVGRFNACTRNRVFVNINESDGKKLKRNFDRVKMIITEPTNYLELKGIDAYAIDNFAHVLFTTNGDADGNVELPAQAGQRRLIFQRVSDQYATGRCSSAERKTYFNALVNEMDDERSLGAFLWLLQQRDLSDYDPYAKLVTDEEVRQRGLTMTSPIRWLWDLIALGKMPAMFDTDVTVGLVYGAYVEWARQHGDKPVGVGPWGKAVSPFIWESTRRTNTERFGVLVAIEELEKRLRTVSDPTTKFIGVIWNDGTEAPVRADVVDTK